MFEYTDLRNAMLCTIASGDCHSKLADRCDCFHAAVQREEYWCQRN
jgi:hypothetical protein